MTKAAALNVTAGSSCTDGRGGRSSVLCPPHFSVLQPYNPGWALSPPWHRLKSNGDKRGSKQTDQLTQASDLLIILESCLGSFTSKLTLARISSLALKEAQPMLLQLNSHT